MAHTNFLVIALGNPGEKYAKTRHNAGWIVLDEILGADIPWEKSKNAQALYYRDEIGDDSVEYMKPQTMMNASGISAKYARDKHSIPSENIIVMYDDIDLPLGAIKISHDRGDGGHNGVKSIIQQLGSTEFTRIRIGISKPLENGKVIKPNVLGAFSKEEMNTLHSIVEKTKQGIELILKDGVEKAMNICNA